MGKSGHTKNKIKWNREDMVMDCMREIKGNEYEDES